jgi:hypothetical protein
MLKLSEAIELGTFLERPGSPLSFKACALGLAMSAVGIPVKERTFKKAEQLWPWLGEASHRSFFGFTEIDHMRDIGEWYFNVRLGRMTMATLINRVRHVEPVERKLSHDVFVGVDGQIMGSPDDNLSD